MASAKRKTVSPTKKKPAPAAKSASKKPSKTPKKAAPAKAKTAAKPSKARAARTKAVGPTQPLPRRAIFIDVENTSNEAALTRVIEALDINRAKQPTEFYAVGNWRAVGQTMSRHLARLGASLVHSAPVTGVRDWSDLWIAVAAGRWIALAQPGDLLEIVSDDKAFEAVGDAAATAGVIFRRVAHRSGSARSTAAAAAASETPAEGAPRRRRRRGGRGRRRGSGNGTQATIPQSVPATDAPRSAPRRAQGPRRQDAPRRQEQRRPEPTPKPIATAESAADDVSATHAESAADAHGASHDHIVATIRRLTNGDPNKWVNLDVIATALKAEGFVRPPGSTRLVVRLRRMKDIEVQPSGMVRLVG